MIRRLNGHKGQDDAFIQAEFYQMREQLRFEKSQHVAGWGELFTRPSHRKRLILAVLVQAFTQLSGINVINYYQTDLYKGLGMVGHNVTLLAGYGNALSPVDSDFTDGWSVSMDSLVHLQTSCVCTMSIHGVVERPFGSLVSSWRWTWRWSWVSPGGSTTLTTQWPKGSPLPLSSASP